MDFCKSLATVGLFISLAAAVACNSAGSPTQSTTATPDRPPTLEATIAASPTPRRLEDTPTPQQTYNPPISTATATPSATALPTQQPPAETPKPTYTPPPTPPPATSTPPPATTTPPPTPTQQPPQPPPAATATAAPTLTLEERAQAIIDKYRNDTTTVITDYSTIKPIVDAVLQGSGLKYDNLIPQIWTPERFNRFYCQNDPKCVEALNKDPSQGSAFVSDRFVITREGQFYQVITSALREMFLGIAFNNYNAKSERAAEIAGNLGSSFANHTLAEKFGYDPFNNVADTPENSTKIAAGVDFSRSSQSRDWFLVPWLVHLNMSHLDKNKQGKQISAAQALAGYKAFVSSPNPDKTADDLVAKFDVKEVNSFVIAYLQAKLNPNSQPKSFDQVVLMDNLFALP